MTKQRGKLEYYTVHYPQSLSDHKEKDKLTCREPAVKVQLPACVCAAERVQSVGDEIVSLHKEWLGLSNCYIWGIVTCKQGKQWCFQTLQKSKIFASPKHGWTLTKSLMPYQVSWDRIVSNQNSQKLEFAINWLNDTQKFFPNLQTSRETSLNLNSRVITPLSSTNKHGTS